MRLFSPSFFKVFLPFAIGYFLSYLFRVVNAVIAPDLVADLNINPSQLGLLTGTYFIAFASSQLPLGIFLDRFGPRVVESLLLIFAGIGALIFSLSNSLTGVIIGRAFIGFGVSACLMAAFKSYVIWFPEKLWPRINGFQMAAGGFGALSATLPVEWVLNFTDWRGLFQILALFSLGIAVIIFFVVPEKESIAKPSESLSEQINGIKLVFKSIKFWQIAPLTTLSQASYLSLQGLWAGPWLRDIAQLSRPEIARILSFSAMAMITGYITLGFVAEKLNKKGFDVLYTAIIGMSLFIGTQALIIFNTGSSAKYLWIAFGFFGTSGILSYTALSSSFPKELSGRVTTGINLMVFIAAFILQWAIGAVINLWEISSSGNYHVDGYKTAFLIILALQISGLAWCLFAGAKNKSQAP